MKLSIFLFFIRFVPLVSLPALLFLSPVMASEQLKTSAEVDSLKNIYDSNITAIDNEFGGKLRAWPDDYLKDLDTLQKKMQKAGDLDGWQAVNNEVIRFKSERSIPTSVLTAPASDLQSIQKKFQILSVGIETEKSRRILALTEKYVARLTSMQKNLTVSGKIEDALLVNSEIKRVKALPKVSAAEFALMTIEAEKVPESKAAVTPPVEEKKADTAAVTGGAAGAGGDASKARVAGTLPPGEAAGDASGAKIYDGQAAPPISGVTFKSVSLSGTERMRVVKKVTASVMLGKKSSTSVNTSAGVYTSSHERSGSVQNCIRVTVKASNVSYVLDGLKVVVQVFVKDASGKGGGAKEVRTEVVKLPKIEGGKQVCVEIPPVVTSSSSVRSRSSYYDTTSTVNSGQDYYGVVVSVFDESAALAYQGASSDKLESMGIAEMPKEKPNTDVVRERFHAARDVFFQARSVLISSPKSDAARDAYLASSNEFVTARESYFESIGSPVPPFPPFPSPVPSSVPLSMPKSHRPVEQ